MGENFQENFKKYNKLTCILKYFMKLKRLTSQKINFFQIGYLPIISIKIIPCLKI